MRALVIATALASAASPAWAAADRPPLNADPYTASGRFDLPTAAAGYVGRVSLGEVRVDPGLATKARLEPERLTAAVRTAAERSLANFGYLAAPAATDPRLVDVEMLPVSAAVAEGGLATTVRLKFAPRVADSCLAAVGEGRFKALDRQRSGGARRAFATGASVALAFVLVDASAFLTSELQTASVENQAANGLRKVVAGEGVSPDFSEKGRVRFAAAAATQLAFADYLRQLGASAACRAG